MKDPEEMDMPCPCRRCGEWFDLNDGYASKKWYPNTVICESCGAIEEQEIEVEDEIQEVEGLIDDAEWSLSHYRPILKELKQKLKILQG